PAPVQERDLATVEKPKTERPALYEVLLHNDDYTTQEFVVYILMKFFHHDADAATKIMLHVHTKGIGVAGVVTHHAAPTQPRRVRSPDLRGSTRCPCSAQSGGNNAEPGAGKSHPAGPRRRHPATTRILGTRAPASRAARRRQDGGRHPPVRRLGAPRAREAG